MAKFSEVEFQGVTRSIKDDPEDWKIVSLKREGDLVGFILKRNLNQVDSEMMKYTEIPGGIPYQWRKRFYRKPFDTGFWYRTMKIRKIDQEIIQQVIDGKHPDQTEV